MKYSIVMPVFLREDAHKQVVLNTLESIKKNSSECEIIIIDDGSTLLTGFLRDFADIYIRHKTNMGIAPSWNDGKNVSRGEYVVFVNDDILVPEKWLEAMAWIFYPDMKPNAGVAAPKGAGPTVKPYVFHGPEDAGLAKADINQKFYPGYCFMLKRDRFFEDFDEQFIPFNYEDTDYWERMTRKGFEMWRMPLDIWHAEGDVLHKLSYGAVSEQNKQRFINKHGFDPMEKFYS